VVVGADRVVKNGDAANKIGNTRKEKYLVYGWKFVSK
jgi:methylthioribose-1-phosphate isomerase